MKQNRGLLLEVAKRQREWKSLLPYKLHPKQQIIYDEIFLNNRKRVLVVAGCSFGKSAVEGAVAMGMGCFPNKSSFIIGPTRKQQKEVMWEGRDSIKELVPMSFGAKFMESESRIEFPEWGSFIKIDGSENYDAFRGVAGDLWLFDEAQMCDFRFYDAIYPRLSKRNGALVVVGTMVRDLNNRFMQLWREAQSDPDWLVIHAPSADNPSENVQEFLKKEKDKYLKRGDHATWALEFDCVYMPGGKDAVYPQYDPKKHNRPRDWFTPRVDRELSNIDFFTCFDPGSTSVFAVLLCAINRDTAEIYVLDEVYEKNKNMTTPRTIWSITSLLEKKWFRGKTPVRIFDEAAAWFGIQMGSELNIGLVPAQKNSRDKMDDIGLIKDAIAASKFFVNMDDCPRFIEEMLSYETDENGRPKEKNDHQMDNCRYIVRVGGYTMNPKAIQEDGEHESNSDSFLGGGEREEMTLEDLMYGSNFDLH